eukprot:TRINITY_DN27543_c0_g1_i1.p1 TRINITY_DN27543_c0_g1~~TRINITY_DN27543_c0_g1_i1.p1  ORF type:complete len:547 (+),score=165.11 TRINITY_DN27543_c0_g1_i1:89-1729(+)
MLCSGCSNADVFGSGEVDTIHVTVLSVDGLGSLDRYYVKLKASFNKQSFRTSIISNSPAPQTTINEHFQFFTSKLAGEIVAEIVEHKRVLPDKLLGFATFKLDEALLDCERRLALKIAGDSQRPDVELHIKALASGSPRRPSAGPEASNANAALPVARPTPSASGDAPVATTPVVPPTPTAVAPTPVIPIGPHTDDDHAPLPARPLLTSASAPAAARGTPLNKAATASLPPIVRRPTDRLDDFYLQEGELGRGGMSIVYLGQSKLLGHKVAIKVINKKLLRDPKELQLLQREIDIMRKLHHPNLLELYDVFETPDSLCLVMELASGGELFDAIIKRGGFYPEAEAARLIAQLLEAIKYCHSLGVAHRDLKPENLLLVERSTAHDQSEALKIADFGLAKDFAFEAMETQCGTPDYVAPEVILEDVYNQACDIWSIGVITYVVLCGSPPFYSSYDPPRQRDLFDKITKAQYEFFAPEWNSISADAKDFISKVLVVDANVRYTADQCLKHPWITKHRQAASDFKRSSHTFDYGKFKTYAGKYNKKYDKS